MSTGALENISQQKSGRAIALPAPPPPRSLTEYYQIGLLQYSWSRDQLSVNTKTVRF